MEVTRSVDFSVRLNPDYYEQSWPSDSGRWRFTHTPGIAVAALAMLTGSLAFAAEPWAAKCNPVSTVPMIAATLLFFTASDLMLKPRPPYARFRDQGLMQACLVATTLMLMFCVLANTMLAWPVLFPLFVFPMSLPIILALGVGVVSRMRMSVETWRVLIIGCLILATTLSISGMPFFQNHVACRWTGA